MAKAEMLRRDMDWSSDDALTPAPKTYARDFYYDSDEEAKEEKKVVKKGWFSSSDDKIKAVKAEIAHIRKLLKEAGCPKAEEMKHSRFHIANEPVFF